MMKILSATLFVLLVVISGTLKGQNYNETLGQEGPNAITTAVPFLMIAPDSRSGALGDAGVALSVDGYAQHWNSAKYAFINKPLGITVSYTPWLQNLVKDINLAYLTGFYRIDDKQTIGTSLRYFSMGNITFTDINGDELGNFSPHEFAIDASYNRKLSDHFALGITGRFILSNLTGGQSATGDAVNAGQSGAVDISGYYNNDVKLGSYGGDWAFGFNLSNIGAKLGYTEESKNFLPTNMRLGGKLSVDFDEYNSLSGTLDLNKLLVPTPPIYYADSTDANGNKVIAEGKDPNISVAQGMFQSFYDAPGGFKEEMQEFSIAGGLEYWYAKQFAVRAGYFWEHENKGNRKYFTAGVGLKMNVFGLDFSYLIPTGNFNTSPLGNTWRFSLVFDMESFNNQ